MAWSPPKQVRCSFFAPRTDIQPSLSPLPSAQTTGTVARGASTTVDELRRAVRSQKEGIAGLSSEALSRAHTNIEQLSAAYAQYCDGLKPRVEPLLGTFKTESELSVAIDTLALALVDSSPGGTRRWAEDGMLKRVLSKPPPPVVLFWLSSPACVSPLLRPQRSGFPVCGSASRGKEAEVWLLPHVPEGPRPVGQGERNHASHVPLSSGAAAGGNRPQRAQQPTLHRSASPS